MLPVGELSRSDGVYLFLKAAAFCFVRGIFVQKLLVVSWWFEYCVLKSYHVFHKIKQGLILIFAPKMYLGLFSGDPFPPCTTIYIDSKTVLSSSSGCCTRVEGRVSLRAYFFGGG